MKKIILLTIWFICGLGYSQDEASNWYFGFNSGLKFNLTNNTVTPLNDGNLNTLEGCTSISNDTGDLLFYTDGITVWNKKHDVMSNGFGLLGDPSSTQSAIIVPKPEDDYIYYIFTVDDFSFQQPHFGLNYSIVDMSLDGGSGAITTKNMNLLNVCSEKITGVIKDCITKSVWVLSYASENGDLEEFNTFHAFEVNSLGLNTTAVKSIFPITNFDNRGYLKLSPDGTKMASANPRDGLFLYDFETSTGKVSNETELFIQGPNNFPYGIEFSSNSNLLYVNSSNDFFDTENRENNNIPSNHTSKLTQYNLLSSDISLSAVLIDERQLYRGALQLGPNGKIYRALSTTYLEGTPFLGVIDNPNQIGLGCDYQHNAINLSPGISSQGLPPFISSFFNSKIDIIKNGKSSRELALCVGDKYTLSADDIPNASYIWTKDKITLLESTHELEVFEGGLYELYINPNNGDCAIEGKAVVQFSNNPDAFDHVIFQCEDDDISDGFTLFNLNEAIHDLTGGVTDRSVKFYSDSARTIEINGDSFLNTNNPQTIYAKVINDLTGCYSYSELTLELSSTKSENASITVCDDDGNEDGLYEFNLNNANNQLVNGLPAGLTISYFETLDDALLEQNKLDKNYTNTIPEFQTIYARVENLNNCYGISTIDLTVNRLPNIETESLMYYCLNSFPNRITIDAALINDSENNYTYEWSTGQNTYQIEINTIGKYTVTVTNNLGCSKSRTIEIEPSNIATFKEINVIDASEKNTITVLISEDSQGTYQYSLTDSNNILVAPYQDSNVFENVFPGIYTVFVKDIKNDCGVVDDKVSVIGFPKFFTPNNDGNYDTWQVYGITNTFQSNTKIFIYDRYGKLVKELNPLGEGWNGLLNGQKLPSDDYWFVVKLEDGRIFKSHFSLIN
jgi:gliding motility-associated-like protein